MAPLRSPSGAGAAPCSRAPRRSARRRRRRPGTGPRRGAPPTRHRSTKMPPSPNDALASTMTERTAAGRSTGSVTLRMPRPPPPAEAFTISGYPTLAAVSAHAASSPSGSISAHGASGTPEASASRLDSILSPRARIATDDGPRNTMPSASRRATNSASSETKPQPGHTASHPAGDQAIENEVVIGIGGSDRSVRAGAQGRAERDGSVGQSDEGRVSVGVGVERHHLERCAVDRADLAGGPEEPDRGIGPVEDRRSVGRVDSVVRRPASGSEITVTARPPGSRPPPRSLRRG